MGTLKIGVQLLLWGILKVIPLLIVGDLLCIKVVKQCNVKNKVEYKIFTYGIYLSVVFVWSLTINGLFKSINTSELLEGINVIPVYGSIQSIRLALDLNLKDVINLLGNVGIFVPFGFFLSYFMKPNRKLVKFSLYAILFSASIEIVQLIFGRCFDIDDIILNTLGALLGYYFFTYINEVIYSFGVRQIISGDTVVLKIFPLKCLRLIFALALFIRILV